MTLTIEPYEPNQEKRKPFRVGEGNVHYGQRFNKMYQRGLLDSRPLNRVERFCIEWGNVVVGLAFVVAVLTAVLLVAVNL